MGSCPFVPNPASLPLGPSYPGDTLGTGIEQGGGIVRFPWKLIGSYIPL